MKRKAFTNLELLIVIGISTILFSLGVAAFSSFERSLQADMHEEAIALLTEAARRARSGHQNSDWGVYFNFDDGSARLDSMTLFAGESYATRDTTQDLTVDASAAFVTDFSLTDVPPYSGGGKEIVFEVRSGDPHQTGTFTLQSSNLDTTFQVDQSGIPMIEH